MREGLVLVSGIVFEEIEGNGLSYKIRLRHEVGELGSWMTDLVGPRVVLPGPRIQNEWVVACLLH